MVLPWLILVSVNMITSVIVITQGRIYIDSDIASELVLADQLNQTGQLVSPQWWYSTELRFFTMPTLYQVALKLFAKDWYLAQCIVNLSVGRGLIISVMVLSTMVNGSHHGIYSGLFMAFPFGVWYFWYGPFTGSYLPYMLRSVLSVVLILTIGKTNHWMHRITAFVGLTILALISGINGMKEGMRCYLSLVLSLLILWLLSKHFADHRQFHWLLCASVYALGCWFLGYMINSRILVDVYDFMDYSGQVWGSFDLTKMIHQFSLALSIFGFPGEALKTPVKLLSLEGVLGCFGLINATLVVGIMVMLLKRLKRSSFVQQMMIVQVVMVVFVQSIIFGMSYGNGSTNGSYWLVIIPWVAVVLPMGLEVVKREYGHYYRRLMVMFMVSLVATSYTSISLFFKQGMRIQPDLYPVALWLDQQGYDQGYASFWNGNVITEWTNGDIDMWVYSDLT